MILKDHLPGLFSMFVFARDSKLIWSHMIVLFETFIKMSCISKMLFFHNF